MSMYNLNEYSKNYSKTTGSFWNYYRNEPNTDLGGADNNINYSIKDSKSFDYKTSITGKIEGNNTKNEAKIVVPLKYLSNFWRTVDIPLINCEVSLALTRTENCVITNKAYRKADAETAVVRIDNPINAAFQIRDTNLQVPVVTLSTENDKKLLEKLRTRFKRTIKWNKYKSEMTNQTKNNNLYYLIDSTFTKVLRLFVLSFENENYRTSLQVLCTKCPNKRL